jgi:hypothetical protein
MTLKGVFLSSIAALAIVLAGPVGAWQRPVADAGSRSHSAHARQTEWLVTNPRRDTAQGLPGRLGHASPLGGQTGGHAHPYMPPLYQALNMITNDLPETIRKLGLAPVV